MIRKAGESHHNTEAEVREWTLTALAVVTELEVPPRLVNVAYKCAFDALAAKQIAYENIQPASGLMSVPRHG